MTYIVVCREDRQADGAPGEYSLATRRVFPDRCSAALYAAGISPSRDPLVVAGRWGELAEI
jgi:hypothetical protein